MRARTSIALSLVAVVAVAGVGALVWAGRQPPVQHASHAAVVQDAVPAASPVDPVDPVDPVTPGASEPPVDGSHIERLSARIHIAPHWLVTTATQAGIAPVALGAFARAALVVQKTQPGCHLGWNTLAAIGYRESADGTLGGSTVAANGDVTPRILGPVLDGGRYTAVPDSDAGRLDGDRTWDRAVGPLQFLPSTWKSHGLDANGDGVADPNNLDDAALTAGVYLCSSGGDLATGSAWEAAIRSFNHSDSYVTAVRATATTYAARTR